MSFGQRMKRRFMKLKHSRVLAAQLVGLLLFAPCASFAEEPGQDSQALEQAANDPTASLMSVQIVHHLAHGCRPEEQGLLFREHREPKPCVGEAQPIRLQARIGGSQAHPPR